MVDWKGAGLQFITVLLGSSLVLTIFNNLYSGITQPNIYIDVLYPSMNRDDTFLYPIGLQNGDEVNRSSHNKIIIGNTGGSTAKDLRITIHYPESDLLSVNNFFANENASWIRVNSHSWQSEGLSRLSVGGRIEVNATFVNSGSNSFNWDRPPCIISVTYEQASKEYRCSSPLASRFPFDPGVMIIPLIGSLLYLAIIIVPKKLKQIKKKRKEREFVSCITKEVVEVNRMLTSDVNSTVMFSAKSWDSETPDIRRQIFNTYGDYNKIDRLYHELKERDSAFLNKDISSKRITETNIKCSSLADDAVKNVAWSKYLTQTNKQAIPILIVPAIIVISSLSITFFCEYILYYLVEKYDSAYFFIFTSFIARGIVAYFVTMTLFKKLMSNSFDARTGSPEYSKFLSRYGKMKLFVLSLAIMGLPWFIIGDFISDTFRLFDLRLSSLISLSTFTVIGVSLDICRMVLMIYIVPRFKVTITKLYKILGLISGLSGLLYVLFALQLDYSIINNDIVSPLLTSLVIGDEHYDFSNLGTFSDDENFAIIPFFSLEGFVLIGIAQIIWALQIRRHNNTIWHFFGVSGATVLTGMLIMGLAIVFTISYELEPNKEYHRIFGSIYEGTYSVLTSTSIIIILVFLQVSYIAITSLALIREKELKTKKEKKEILPSKAPQYTKIGRVRQRILILVPTTLLICVLASTYFGGSIIGQSILTDINSDVPKNGTQIVTSLAVQPKTNTIYALLQPSYDFPRYKAGLAVINGASNYFGAFPFELDGPVRAIAFNPNNNMRYVISDLPETGRSVLTITNGSTEEAVNNCHITTDIGTLKTLTINPASNSAYALGENSDKVLEIDQETCRVHPIELQTSQNAQEGLLDLAVNVFTNMIYVADSSLPGVFVINGTSRHVIANITTDEPFGFEEQEGEPFRRYLFVNPNTNLVYVLGGESIAIINGASNTIVNEISLGIRISAFDINLNNSILYAGANNGSVYAVNSIDGNILDKINLGQIGEPASLVVNPITSNLYMTTWRGNNVYLMDDSESLVANGTIGPFRTERPDIFSNTESSKIE